MTHENKIVLSTDLFDPKQVHPNLAWQATITRGHVLDKDSKTGHESTHEHGWDIMVSQNAPAVANADDFQNLSTGALCVTQSQITLMDSDNRFLIDETFPMLNNSWPHEAMANLENNWNCHFYVNRQDYSIHRVVFNAQRYHATHEKAGQIIDPWNDEMHKEFCAYRRLELMEKIAHCDKDLARKINIKQKIELMAAQSVITEKSEKILMTAHTNSGPHVRQFYAETKFLQSADKNGMMHDNQIMLFKHTFQLEAPVNQEAGLRIQMDVNDLTSFQPKAAVAPAQTALIVSPKAAPVLV